MLLSITWRTIRVGVRILIFASSQLEELYIPALSHQIRCPNTIYVYKTSPRRRIPPLYLALLAKHSQTGSGLPLKLCF